MNSEMLMVAVITRAVTLVIATLGGILCIYLGWRLFFEAIKADAKVQISSESLKITIQTAAPGIFFVFFGAALLIVSMLRTLEIGEPSGPLTQEGLRSYSNDYKQPERSSQLVHVAANSAASVPASSCSKCKCTPFKWFDNDAPLEREEIATSLDVALGIMKEKLSQKYSPDIFEAYKILLRVKSELTP